MIKDNIRAMREAKGLSQEDLAGRLHAVRQTVSKWERGLSVPDAEMVMRMAEIFGVPASALLGKGVLGSDGAKAEEVGGEGLKAEELKVISEKLEAINAQLAKRKKMWWKVILGLLLALCAAVVVIMVALWLFGGAYQGWDYGDPETAVLGTALHSFEWAFVRVAPVVLVLAVAGTVILLARKQK